MREGESGNRHFRMLDTIRSVLDNEKVCDNTFKGLNPHGLGDAVNIINYTNSSNEADSIQTGVTYGEGSSKFTISKMTIKDYSKGRADFEVIFEPKNALQIIRKLPIFLNLVSNSDTAKIKDCMSDRYTFLSGACHTLDGYFSDLKRLRSIFVMKYDSETMASESNGNLILEKNSENGQNHMGDINVEELITSNDQLIKGDLNITNLGADPEDMTPKLTIGTSSTLATLNTQEKDVFNWNLSPLGRPFLRLKFDGSKYLEFSSTNNDDLDFKTSLKRIILEDFNKTDNYNFSLSKTDEDAEEGYVATRLWVHNYLKSLLIQLLSTLLIN